MDKKKRSALELSLDAIRDLLYAAIRVLGESLWINEVFPSEVIYSDDAAGKQYKRGWSILDGQVQLSETETEVERVWVEKRAAQAASDAGSDETAEIRAALGTARDVEGTAWDVVIAAPGPTLNGWFFDDAVLRAAETLFEGVDANLYDLPDGGGVHVPDNLFDAKRLLVRKKAGWIDGVRYTAGVGLTGVLHFLDSFGWLGKNLLTAAAAGHAPYGLSLDCPTRAKMDTIDGKKLWRALEILAADSVDIVTRPAAGGKFQRAVAAQDGEDPMKKKLIAMLKQKRPDLLEGVDTDTMTDDELERRATMAMTPIEPKAGDGNKPDDGKPDGLDPVQVLRCEMTLDRTLGRCELPASAQERVRRAFAGQVFTDEALQTAIGDEKDYLASLTPPPDVAVPGSGIGVGIDTVERAQMAVDRMFGLTGEDAKILMGLTRLDGKPFFADGEVYRSRQAVEDYAKSLDDVPAFGGIREMYTFFTGDHEVNGHFMPKNLPRDLRARMDITSATFSYVLGNTMGRMLVKGYRAGDFQENLLISTRKNVKDFRQQEAVLVGYFGDLETADPESGDFQEIGAVSDEESTYTVTTRGNILTITRKTIINDDISLVLRLVSNLGRSARRTHAQFVWNFFINNSTCSDGTAIATEGHGNLGATALGIATALVAYKALGKMTEKDSSKRIGWLDDVSIKPNLVGPIDILESLEGVAEDEFYYATNDLTDKTRNAMRGKVNAHPVSLLTDTNDWGLIMPPEIADLVEMGYLNGRQEPEMFLADSPQSEQVFVADKIRHKIRHEYSGAAIDYRGWYKAVVT